MHQQPLTVAAKALKAEILAIPRTDEPMTDDLPEGIDIDTIGRLHALAVSGSQQAAPEIRRLLARYPEFPKLLNYLQASHTVRNEHRQAEAVLKKLADQHPDYLFTRIALANKALEKDQPERAAAQLGPTLKIGDLYPDRDVFHVSELKNYYLCVARILARRGDQDQARGVKAALSEIDHDETNDIIITQEVMMANLRSTQKRLEEDKKRRVTVRPAPLPDKITHAQRPEFHHDVIADLYEFDMDLPEECIHEILALPRQSLVVDLIAVLEDCILRTPDFMRAIVEEEGIFAAFHALHLLAEIHGHEACGSLLRLLEMNPQAVDFWLGEVNAYIPQIARIIPGDLAACVAWLISPGIESRAKGMVAEAMEQIAKCEPARLMEITSGLGEVLAFIIESPPQDNILDTGFLFILISVITDLRAAELLPVIRRAYEKNLVELFKVGPIEQVEEDMANPMGTPIQWLSMPRQYDEYFDDAEPEDEFDDSDEEVIPYLPTPLQTRVDSVVPDPFHAPADLYSSAPAPMAGRNDPCPCGSGKKFKKCCMR